MSSDVNCGLRTPLAIMVARALSASGAESVGWWSGWCANMVSVQFGVGSWVVHDGENTTRARSGLVECNRIYKIGLVYDEGNMRRLHNGILTWKSTFFLFITHPGILITHKLIYTSVSRRPKPAYSKDRCLHRFIVTPRLVSDWIAHFHPKLAEVTLSCAPDSVCIRSFWDEEAGEEKGKKGWYHTWVVRRDH